MTQSEINAKAMADIFALEDSKDLFEAIGVINDPAMPADTEYGPDDMLTVIPGSPDTFGGQSVGAPVQEPSDDDKRFVVDSFAEKMANAHKTIVDEDAIDTFSPIIQQEAGPKINVRQFLTDMMNSATQRLSAQNVSEAQPTGATPEEPIAAPTEGEPADPMTAVDPMGTPAMEPASGAIAPEPSLDTNPDNGLGLDGITDAGLDGLGAEPEAPADDLGLDGITDDAAVEPEAAPAEDDLGLDAITDDTAAEPEATPEADSANEEAPADDTPAEETEPAPEDDVLGDSNLDTLSDDTFGSDSDADSEVPEEESDADFEAEMAQKKAQLESIYANFIEDRARNKIRTMVESYMAKKESNAKVEAEEPVAEEQNATPDTATTEPVVNDDTVNAAADAKRNELGKKVADMVESAKGESRAMDLLEAAKRAYAKVNSEDKELDRLLESISTNYHKVQAEKKSAEKLQAKLESISEKYAPKSEPEKATEQKPMTESVQSKNTGLNAQLQEIIDSL